MATATDILAAASAPAPAKKSETGDKPPASKLGNCRCGTVKVGKGFTRGNCTAQTKKNFAQGHDARMSARVATEIAEGSLPMADGLDEVRRAGGGEQLVSKTQWSANLRAKKLQSRKTKKCRSCGDADVAAEGDAKTAGLCDDCNEEALEENHQSDNGVTIKIGRWEYPATIDNKGDAHYKNRRDEDMTATKGSFSLVK